MMPPHSLITLARLADGTAANQRRPFAVSCALHADTVHTVVFCARSSFDTAQSATTSEKLFALNRTWRSGLSDLAGLAAGVSDVGGSIGGVLVATEGPGGSTGAAGGFASTTGA